MTQRRFFVLDESCPASEIPNMMCRVVADKLLPLAKFAPIEPLSPSEPRHNPQDIIASILPPPSLSTNRKDFLEAVHSNKLSASLTSFFGFDFARSTEERLILQTKSVKRYTLNNPEVYFKTLMQNEYYARDIRQLLEDSKHAYLVVGFLTTTGAIWTQSRGKNSHDSASVTLPISELAGVPMPQLDAKLCPSRTVAMKQSREMRVAQEEIFAIAYCSVKLSYSFDKTAPKLMKKTPVVGPPKRAKAKHLAMGGESDEEIDDDLGQGTVEKADNMIVALDEDDFEDIQSRQDSFELDL
jgi:hypothetical protein